MYFNEFLINFYYSLFSRETSLRESAKSAGKKTKNILPQITLINAEKILKKIKTALAVFWSLVSFLQKKRLIYKGLIHFSGFVYNIFHQRSPRNSYL